MVLPPVRLHEAAGVAPMLIFELMLLTLMVLPLLCGLVLGDAVAIVMLLKVRVLLVLPLAWDSALPIIWHLLYMLMVLLAVPNMYALHKRLLVLRLLLCLLIYE
jgi:hypothetical protein